MFFSEANEEYQQIPQWAGFLIRMGYSWPYSDAVQKRIALISMPCDSAAAGLFALGALIRDLGNPNANNVDGHYDALLRFARQYLQSCRDCELTECNPDIKRCGYLAKATGRLRSTQPPRKTAIISDRTNLNKREIWWEYMPKKAGKVTEYSSPQNTIKWYIDGESPVQVSSDNDALPENVYNRLVVDAEIITDNLCKTFSGLCFAGRVAGGSDTRRICSSIRFYNGINAFNLHDLLAVQGWSPSNAVSRTAFFNSRTESLSPYTAAPSLVVADGDESFLKVLGRSEFQRSDIIGIIHRIVDRDRLEAISDKIAGMRQWYVEDSEMLEQSPAKPAGVSIAILKKRVQ